MTKNTLHYSYNAKVREIYDLTKDEALTLILKERKLAQIKNHAVILTNKREEESSFSANASKKLSRNFTWIHFCPQELLNFDDDTLQEEKYYVMIFESVENI